MGLLTIRGVPLLLGDNVSSDIILQARYSLLSDLKEMAKHVLEDLGSEIAQKIQNCSIIVAGKNFGCGTGREASAVALKAAGVKVVLARSFSRIFFRNAINHGIAAIEWDRPDDLLKEGESLEISIMEGIVRVDGQSFQIKKLPPMVMNILNAGGLIEYARKKLGRR